ncbi:MAG: NAD(P) transhydrogenase subunit alpha, partial [Ignavibacteriaceae bacterium]|nr:NAD(P) transhydrogenase subunit alpha [Ignavibacteriaceae bacterium]
GGTIISFLYPLNYKEILDVAVKEGANLISMDFVPRTTLAQKMDALSSQANIAGFKSVLVGAVELPKIFPLMMTAAGTVKPAKVVIMGAGVAGLQALGTAKRLGAIVEVSDIRPAVKQEVESLGGRFIEVEMDPSMQDERGYAKEATPEFLQKQKELIFKHVTNADLVITTALVPGRKAPILVSAEMIKNMRPGSVVVDIATEFGGNCELSEHNKTVISNGVKIISAPNLASEVSTLSSELYGKNLLALISHLSKDGVMNIDSEDEILKGCLIVKKGEIVNKRVKEFYGL